MSDTKRCGYCKFDLPLEMYASSQRSRDGLTKNCEACRQKTAAAQHRSYARHRAKRIAEVIEWRAQNRDRVRSYDRQYYKASAGRKCRQKAVARERAKAEGRTAADRITKSYVANVWKMRVGDLPDDLYEAQRAHLLLKRAIKEATK